MTQEVSTDPGDLTACVSGLLQKYGRSAPSAWRVLQGPPEACEGVLTLAPGWSLPQPEAGDDILPLLPWRHERRFVELRKMLETRTLEVLSMCRFSCFTNGRGMDLAAVLYREFDLAEWLADSTIVSVTATIQGGRWANVLLRLASGVLCGVEAGTSLPTGTAMQDRHELIARRGVACDRVVDTQVPQSSVYAVTANGTTQFTDTDAELFGLSQDSVNLVRAACDALIDAERPDALRRQHRRLSNLVSLAFESDRRGERLGTEGGMP